jgi:hypothetical protein
MLAVVGSLAASLTASAAENIALYTHQAQIVPEQQANWYQVEIPISVQWQAAHADLRDVRVFNAEGESLPYALVQRAARQTRERREVAARLFPLYADSEASLPEVAQDGGLRVRRSADGSVDIEVKPGVRPTETRAPAGKILRGWLLDVGTPDFVPELLRLKWADEQEGFFRFSIAASDDLEHWRDWGEGRIVQLGFDGQSITQREIHLPPRPAARYLRLLWQDAGQASALRGAQLSGAVSSVEPAPLTWSPLLTGEPIPGREREFIWQFPHGLPFERVSIAVDEANTLAPVILSGRTPAPPAPVSTPVSAENKPLSAENKPLAAEILRGERRVRDTFKRDRHHRRQPAPVAPTEASWRTLASGVVYRLPASTGMGEQVEEELNLPAISVSQLRLQIDPRSGGLGVQAPPRIKVAVRGRELTFLARGSAPYRLAYGRADAPAADLPLTTLIPSGTAQATAAGQIGRAVVTAPAPASDPVVAPAPPLPTENPDEGKNTGKTVLWAVLLGGVALLVGMAVSLLRAGKTGNGPASGPTS